MKRLCTSFCSGSPGALTLFAKIGQVQPRRQVSETSPFVPSTRSSENAQSQLCRIQQVHGVCPSIESLTDASHANSPAITVVY